MVETLSSSSELLQALDILNQLAAMDTLVYQSTLSSYPEKSHDNALALQSKLDHLQVDHRVHRLSQSIHRLHSHVLTLTLEYQTQEQENLELQTKFQSQEETCRKLSRQLQKAQARNSKLQEKLTRQKEERKSIRKHMQHCFQQIQQSEDKQMQQQVQFHDFVLKRERLVSQDSTNASDAALESPKQDSNSSCCSIARPTTPSCITDDGIATVRLERSPSTPSYYSTSSPTSTVVSPWRSSWNAKSTVGHVYSLNFVTPPSFQCQRIVLHEAPQISLDDKVHGHHSDEYGFIVTGFDGFDDSANVRPTLGARLLQIDKVTVDPSWTVPQVHQALETAKACSFRNDPLTPEQREQYLQQSFHLPSFFRNRTHSSEKNRSNSEEPTKTTFFKHRSNSSTDEKSFVLSGFLRKEDEEAAESTTTSSFSLNLFKQQDEPQKQPSKMSSLFKKQETPGKLSNLFQKQESSSAVSKSMQSVGKLFAGSFH